MLNFFHLNFKFTFKLTLRDFTSVKLLFSTLQLLFSENDKIDFAADPSQVPLGELGGSLTGCAPILQTPQDLKEPESRRVLNSSSYSFEHACPLDTLAHTALRGESTPEFRALHLPGSGSVTNPLGCTAPLTDPGGSSLNLELQFGILVSRPLLSKSAHGCPVQGTNGRSTAFNTSDPEAHVTLGTKGAP